jgi:hypothetical protein
MSQKSTSKAVVRRSAEDIIRDRLEKEKRDQAEEQAAELVRANKALILSAEELQQVRQAIYDEIPRTLMRFYEDEWRSGKLTDVMEPSGTSTTLQWRYRPGRPWFRSLLRTASFTSQELAGVKVYEPLFLLSDGRLALQGAFLLSNGKFEVNSEGSSQKKSGLYANAEYVENWLKQQDIEALRRLLYWMKI